MLDGNWSHLTLTYSDKENAFLCFNYEESLDHSLFSLRSSQVCNMSFCLQIQLNIGSIDNSQLNQEEQSILF